MPDVNLRVIQVNNGWSNGVLPNGSEPLPGPMVIIINKIITNMFLGILENVWLIIKN